MGVLHYTTLEIAELLRCGPPRFAVGGHVEACEQCHMLFALVRRSRGEPSDEQAEVLVDALLEPRDVRARA